MKSVLISNLPKWCGKICHEIGKDENGKPIYEKSIEVRKGRPSEVPFRCLIYATKPKKWYKSGPLLISDESLWLVNGKVKMCDGLELWADSVENYHCLNGKIIGEFICDKVYNIEPIFSFYDCYSGYDDSSDSSYFENYSIDNERLKKTCLTIQDLYIYGEGKTLYGWHISDLKIYDKPKEFSEFNRPCPSKNHNCEPCIRYGKPYTWDFDEKTGKIFCSRRVTRPPQSWMYVEEIETR